MPHYTLFLQLKNLQELGPTKFKFKDDNGQIIKVEIGENIKCSCNKSKGDHCTHSLYVMQKIYRISQDNPLLWQKNYINQSIEDLLKYRYQQQNEKKKHKFLSKKHFIPNFKINDNSKYEESICPICHEEMNPIKEALYSCFKQCGNNFHVKCLLIWMEHKTQTKSFVVTCPCCRIDWETSIQLNIKKELKNFEEKEFTHKNTQCHGCLQKNITGPIFFCVFCDNLSICKNCYHQELCHLEHNKFLYKEKPTDYWKPAPLRQLLKDFKSRSLIHNINNYQVFRANDLIKEIKNYNFLEQQQQLKEETKEFLENEKDSCNNFQDIIEYLLDIFPDINSFIQNQQNQNENKFLEIIGTDIKKNQFHCIICDKSTNKLKRLFCGHCIDENCLKQFLLQMEDQNYLECPKCKNIILKGLHNLIKQKQFQNQKKQNQIIKQPQSKVDKVQQQNGKQQCLKNQHNSNNILSLNGQNFKNNEKGYENILNQQDQIIRKNKMRTIQSQNTQRICLPNINNNNNQMSLNPILIKKCNIISNKSKKQFYNEQKIIFKNNQIFM